MTEPWCPTPHDLDGIFADLRAYPCAVLAVSGGSDSVALMHLVARWAREIGADGSRISVATVDHGLRPGSQDDARFVLAEAERLGFAATVLPWRGDKPVQGVQVRARAARYDLLGQYAVMGGVLPCAIVTAHTEDDQAETLLMRLARGSGADGLQGMRPVRALTAYPGVDVVRPLLGVGRGALRSYLAAAGGRWVDDPSNADERFERVRIRAAATVLDRLGLTPRMLALAAQRQRRAVEALDVVTDRLAAAALQLNGGMFGRIDGRLFGAEPMEIRVRLLQRVLGMFGGRSPPAELAQVETLAELLARDGAVRTTLGGCEVRACRAEIRIYRERGRAALEAVDLAAGDHVTWDNRFSIRVVRSPNPIRVRALDPATFAMVRRHARSRLLPPARAAATLPAVWSGETLISVGGLPPELLPGSSARPDARIETRFIFLPQDRGP
ncbi:MAG: tRNA lysidine(34) synthetase TilS [Hyphomicrobium sp. 32-62-53]|nr:MAG: tRNA lysidine(34) synthetase TilS [Hyphomicrobium sp. 12-62-95]OYX98299.1 MAG: tRNA lysidine(34) synthetase TilS [Hyphomicrobium sp. 32-62-53]